MKKAAYFALSLAALTLAGCGRNEDPTEGATAVANNDMAAVPAAEATVSPGQTFANTAAASDAFEIETSKLAATKAASGKVKAFAENMIKAHNESTAKLKAAASAASPSIAPVAELTPVQQQTLDTLAAKSGAEFDTAYAKAQVDAHQMTLDALKAYSTTGEVPSLKAFATELTPIVAAHLNMAKGL